MALAFYPPSSPRSNEPFSNDGICELAASRVHSPQIALWLVVSYTAFSPLPWLSMAVVFFCTTLLSPIASTFRSGALYAARTFLSPLKETSDRPRHCFPTAKVIKRFENHCFPPYFSALSVYLEWHLSSHYQSRHLSSLHHGTNILASKTTLPWPYISM